jgi:hypothetical protein
MQFTAREAKMVAQLRKLSACGLGGAGQCSEPVYSPGRFMATLHFRFVTV